MRRIQIFIVSIFFTVSLSWFSSISGKVTEPTAPLLTGMGTHHHSIATKSPKAQGYFDQGLVLAYSFNHAEAARSFRQAIKLDPDCAMCNWGLAYVLGPNINAKMEDDAVPESYAVMQKAVKLAENSTESEQAYISALAKRYTDKPLEDRSALDLAYAEALMNTMPWDYWTEKGKPKPEAQKVLDTLAGL